MIKRLSILLVALCALSATVAAQDYARMSERTLMGTARYIGMGGAMTAIGGDPSAVLDNPAGLGLYQRMEMLLTGDVQLDRTWQYGTDQKVKQNTGWVAQASLIFCFPRYSSSKVKANNIMMSYNRLHSFSRKMDAYYNQCASLGNLINTYSVGMDIPYCSDALNASNELHLRESGYIDEYSFDWSMNIDHQWYVGAGLRIQSYLLASDGDYYETFSSQNAEGKAQDIENESSMILSGSSCNFALGVIYRPTQWLRMGLSVRTPSFGTLRTSSYGTFSALTDSVRYSYAPDLNFEDRHFAQPWRASASIALQCGAYGMLAVQYDYAHSKYHDDFHSLRVGLEVVPILGMYLNAGYAYESTFKPTTPVAMDPSFDRQDTYSVFPRWGQYASCAIGYRGAYCLFQVAYQYHWQGLNLYAHEDAHPYNMRTETHRITFTLGWHSN